MDRLPHGWAWDPFRALDLQDLESMNGRFNCIGITKEGNRCGWSIDYGTRQKALGILRSLALKQPMYPQVDDSLWCIADYLLCVERHNSRASHSQAKGKVRDLSD